MCESTHTHTSDKYGRPHPASAYGWSVVSRDCMCVSHHASLLEVVSMMYLVYMCWWVAVCLSFNHVLSVCPPSHVFKDCMW